ncbi:MAG: sensor histidine kinase [Roseiflexaceae bacterium]
MYQSDRQDLPNNSLNADILTPLIVASALFGLMTLALIAGSKAETGIASFVFPTVLLINSLIAYQAQRRGWLRLASLLMSSTLGILPILTVFLLGPAQNAIMFIAPLGVLLGMLVGSMRTGSILAIIGLLLLAVSVFLNPATLLAQAILMLLLIAIGGVGAWATDTIRGTIEWALDTAAKSERRETLLRQTQSELQQAVYERDRLNSTLQQTNRDLEAARAAAEAAYQSKATFLARMSHELRTPLNLVIGFSTAMLDHPEMYEHQVLPAIYHTDIAAIRSSGQHLLGLINDILDLAKVEAGRLELHKAPLALEPLLNEMCKTLGALLMDRPVALRRDWDDGMPTLLADETRVRQVLLNLLSNASKFTDHGEIILGARSSDTEVMIWVRDTGIGIAPADQARIFGEFEQAESNDSRKRGGTGLGLSICRWLIELHGGTMGLESEPNIGSTFFFTLPIDADAAPPTPTRPLDEHSEDVYAVTLAT